MRSSFGAPSRGRTLPAGLSIVLFLGGISVLSGCDGGTHIHGLISDSAGRPVPSANVNLSEGNSSREVLSDASGRFKIGMTHSPFNPELVLTVNKEGFEPFEKRFHSREHLEAIVVRLTRTPERSGPPAQPQTPLQSAQNLPQNSACGMLQRDEGHLSFRPFKILPGESFKGSPVIKFEIGEEANLSNVRLTRSSGVRDIDTQVLAAVRDWKYKPQPGCTFDLSMGVVIDIGS